MWKWRSSTGPPQIFSDRVWPCNFEAAAVRTAVFRNARLVSDMVFDNLSWKTDVRTGRRQTSVSARRPTGGAAADLGVRPTFNLLALFLFFSSISLPHRRYPLPLVAAQLKTNSVGYPLLLFT